MQWSTAPRGRHCSIGGARRSDWGLRSVVPLTVGGMRVGARGWTQTHRLCMIVYRICTSGGDCEASADAKVVCAAVREHAAAAGVNDCGSCTHQPKLVVSSVTGAGTAASDTPRVRCCSRSCQC